MQDQIRSHFCALESALETTALTEERKQYISKSVVKLAILYQQFRETNESRFGDSIAWVVHSILRELEACPEAIKLDARFRERLHVLHEDLGIPRLPLKPAKVLPGPAKASSKLKKRSKL